MNLDNNNPPVEENTFEKVAVVAHAASGEMYERLNVMAIQPKQVLIIGCDGRVQKDLQARYPTAEVHVVDTLFLLQETASCKLSFAPQSMDMIFANWTLPWHANIQETLQAWLRLLRPDGLLLMTALGLDTLKGWYEKLALRPQLMDMHDLGDMLLQLGFSDPVLDVDYYTLSYQDQNKMLREMLGSGLIKDLQYRLEENSNYLLDIELIYAHAFAPALRRADANGEVKVDVETLKQQLLKASTGFKS